MDIPSFGVEREKLNSQMDTEDFRVLFVEELWGGALPQWIKGKWLHSPGGEAASQADVVYPPAVSPGKGSSGGNTSLHWCYSKEKRKPKSQTLDNWQCPPPWGWCYLSGIIKVFLPWKLLPKPCGYLIKKRKAWINPEWNSLWKLNLS